MAGFPIVGVKAVLEDGSYHEVDSSDMAFQVCARGCFRETFLKMKPVLLEPIMKLEVEVPVNFQGSVTGELTSRRGMIVSSEVQGNLAVIEAEVPLAETFGYSTDLRSMTQGQGTFTMEFSQLHAACRPASRKKSWPRRRSNWSGRSKPDRRCDSFDAAASLNFARPRVLSEEPRRQIPLPLGAGRVRGIYSCLISVRRVPRLTQSRDIGPPYRAMNCVALSGLPSP